MTTTRKPILILAGPPNTGKTFAACAAVHEELNRGGQPWFITAIDLHDAFREAVATGDYARLNKQLSGTLLVVDNLGNEPGDTADAVGAIVEAALKARVRGGLDTIITTNILCVADLAKRYSSGLMELVSEHGDWGLYETLHGQGVS